MPKLPPPKPLEPEPLKSYKRRGGRKKPKPVVTGTYRYERYVQPTEMGVYACRVPSDVLPEPFCSDIFLIWDNGYWYYQFSDQRYRGKVVGWIGPLPREHMDEDIPF